MTRLVFNEKNHCNNLLQCFFSLCIFLSCKGGITKPLTNSDSEVVSIEYVLYNSEGNSFKNPFIKIKEKKWRNQKAVIEEIKSLEVSKDSGKEDFKCYYRYTDLESMTSYSYLTFSDTAKMQEKYSLLDSTKVKPGGWDFTHKNIYMKPTGVPNELSDTMIDGLKYKRFRVPMLMMGKHPFFNDCYVSTEKYRGYFCFNYIVNNIIKLPVTTVYFFSLSNEITPSSTTIKFISDTLTDKEKKIFTAWKENTRISK